MVFSTFLGCIWLSLASGKKKLPWVVSREKAKCMFGIQKKFPVPAFSRKTELIYVKCLQNYHENPALLTSPKSG